MPSQHVRQLFLLCTNQLLSRYVIYLHIGTEGRRCSCTVPAWTVTGWRASCYVVFPSSAAKEGFSHTYIHIHTAMHPFATQLHSSTHLLPCHPSSSSSVPFTPLHHSASYTHLPPSYPTPPHPTHPPHRTLLTHRLHQDAPYTVTTRCTPPTYPGAGTTHLAPPPRTLPTCTGGTWRPNQCLPWWVNEDAGSVWRRLVFAGCPFHDVITVRMDDRRMYGTTWRMYSSFRGHDPFAIRWLALRWSRTLSDYWLVCQFLLRSTPVRNTAYSALRVLAVAWLWCRTFIVSSHARKDVAGFWQGALPASLYLARMRQGFAGAASSGSSITL